MPLRKCLAIAGLLTIAASQAAAEPAYLRITDPVFAFFNPIDIPPIYKFKWTTAQGSSDPAEVRHIIIKNILFDDAIDYIQNNPNAPEWSSWEPYAAPNTGTSWICDILTTGNYVFAVQGRDINGVAETIDDLRNFIRVRFPFLRGTGSPLMTVTGDLIDPISTKMLNTPVTEISAAAGTTLTFCWIARPYEGSTVAGYRYQWDIADPNNESMWQMPFIFLPEDGVCSIAQSFAGGSHRIDIETINSKNEKSRVPIVVNMPPLAIAPTTWGAVKALYRSP